MPFTPNFRHAFIDVTSISATPPRMYGRYGHIATLAKKVLAGANSVEGVTAELYQV